jgi:hypothetical protein
MMPKFWRIATQSSAAALVLVALTVVCYRLHLNLALSVLLLMIVVALLACMGSFFSSIFASIIAVLSTSFIDPKHEAGRQLTEKISPAQIGGSSIQILWG